MTTLTVHRPHNDSKMTEARRRIAFALMLPDDVEPFVFVTIEVLIFNNTENKQ